jgi:hypothetical protein
MRHATLPQEHRDLVTRNSLGKGGVVYLARMFKLTLTGLDKAFVVSFR